MAFKQRSSGSFKTMGSSPAKAVETSNESKRANLLKVVPNEAAYNKLSDENKKGFDAAGKKAGLPQKPSPAKIDLIEGTAKKKANQTSPKKAKTSLRSKAKSAWYTMMHHDGGKSSDGQQWKTYKEKKKEFRDNNKGKKAGKPDKDVSWKSGY